MVRPTVNTMLTMVVLCSHEKKKKSAAQNKKKLLKHCQSVTTAVTTGIAPSGICSPTKAHIYSQQSISLEALELLKGHPDRFYKQMGMRKHTLRLLNELQLRHGLLF